MGRRRSVSQIRRSVDGRFVLADSASLNKITALTGSQDDIDVVDGSRPRRDSNNSQYSSSDDGGFLSRRNFITARASWRRPLVASPSQLSLQSAAESARGFLQGLAGGLLKLGANNVGSGGVSELALDELNSGARYQNVYRLQQGQNIYRNLQPAQPAQLTSRQPLHINTVNFGSGSAQPHSHPYHDGGSVPMHLYTPSRITRLFSSSPAGQENYMDSPWALTSPTNQSKHQQHFSDLSTVYPSSAERSLPHSTGSGGNLSRYRYYAHELPALRTIQEETRRMNEHQQQQQQLQHSFVPLQIPASPSWRHAYYQGQQHGVALGPYHSYRPRTRWYPRHYSRLFGRAQSELMSPLPHLNLRSASAIGGLGLDASPESRSSSSGFGSKNNSNQPHGSHHSGSTSEWRLLPPYRPPPPPPAHNSAYFGALDQPPQQAQPQAQVSVPPQPSYSSTTLPYYQHTMSSSSGTNYYGSSLGRPLTPPYTMSHWLDMISRLNAATESVQLPKSVDVGSVDGHYEFDPATPTPSASTPTGGLLREDFNLHVDTTGHHHTLPGAIFHTHTSGLPPLSMGPHTFSALGTVARTKPRISRYDNIEARLQAMKEEFYAYRKRQAMKRTSVAEFESVC